jgi:hypothetical protein
MLNRISKKMKIHRLTLDSSTAVILTLTLNAVKGKNPRILLSATK